MPDQNGEIHCLKDYLGSWVLLYFYPKDDTPGCTKEACTIRDNYPDFQELKLQVLGVSVDSVESHDKFAEKYNLPFILLSDEKKEVVKKYGVWEENKGIASRTSFLINLEGKIAKIYKNVNPDVHAEEVLEYFKNLVVK